MKVLTKGGKYRVIAEINMIPFIDVCLVLLIIFMVMTPFLVRAQINLNLPKASSGENDARANESLKVQVERNGRISIEGRRVASEDVPETLKRLLHHPLTQPVLIEADKDVPFQHVVVVLDAGKKIGAAKLAVSVKPEADRRRPSR
jgi:biopolymer transport protein ExbD